MSEATAGASTVTSGELSTGGIRPSVGPHRKPDAAILLESPRAALRVRLLVPATAAVAAVFSLVAGAGDGLLWRGVLAWIAIHASFAWTAIWSLHDFRPVEYPRLGEHARAWMRVLVRALLREGTWCATVVAIVLVGLFGLVLGAIPGLGDILFVLWTATIGLALFVAAAFLAIAALASFPILVPMTAADASDALTAVSASLSYVRRRSLAYATWIGQVTLATALALVPFAAITGIVAWLLVAVTAWHEGGMPPAASDVLDALSWGSVTSSSGVWSAKLCWWWLGGFVLASLEVGATRIFLCLRRSVDGVPLS